MEGGGGEEGERRMPLSPAEGQQQQGARGGRAQLVPVSRTGHSPGVALLCSAFCFITKIASISSSCLQGGVEGAALLPG